jgi:hypothetical protein
MAASTDYLLRLAMKSERVYAWLRANLAKMQFLIDFAWNRVPRSNVGDVVYYKPQQSEYNYPPRGFNHERFQSAAWKTRQLELLRAGKPLRDTDPRTDSDEDLEDRVFEKGQWVDCCDSVKKWLEAQVVEVGEGEVLVHYDGWHSRWDEWIPVDSYRLKPYGSQNSRVNPKGRGPRIGDNLGGGRKFEGPER